jgi:RNA polymerase sigma-70 factor (ECF subfamily)
MVSLRLVFPYRDAAPIDKHRWLAIYSMRNEIEKHLPALWRFALVVTRDREGAQELVQATCLRALEKSRQYQAGTQLDRWLMTMMMNVWRNELRSQKVRTGAGNVDAENILSFDGSSHVETNIFASQVLTTISGLPEAQRETVLLVYLEGWTYAEAAETLNVPVGTR